MPIYDYECVKCGHVQEIMCKSSDFNNMIKCHSCTDDTSKRVHSVTSVRMKTNAFGSRIHSRTTDSDT